MSAHLQAFHHASLGAPVVTTLIRAINNNWLTSFPGLTADGIRKHLPKSIQTTMGHMHKVRQNIRSTIVVTDTEIMEENKDTKDPSEDYLPPQDPLEDYLPPRLIKNRDHILQITAIKFKDLKGMTSSDQTGAFPHTSAKGNQYVMIMEDSDTGTILAI